MFKPRYELVGGKVYDDGRKEYHHWKTQELIRWPTFEFEPKRGCATIRIADTFRTLWWKPKLQFIKFTIQGNKKFEVTYETSYK